MIEFLKIRNVKSPKRNYGDAGIDCFIPEYSVDFYNRLNELNAISGVVITDKFIKIMPQQSILIPLGLKSKFMPDIALEAANKSGVATKKKLFIGASVIDSSYQGEIHAHFVNVGNSSVTIEYGEKIVQFIPRKIDDSSINVEDSMSEEEFYSGIKTDRGAGGFGSTGIK